MGLEEWKNRGTEDQPYRARRVSHETHTDIEHGEKTWTTAQTVRDLMQNHLDAETGSYFRQLTRVVMNRKHLEKYSKASGEDEKRQKIDDFLQKAYLFAKHVEDMTPETRAVSEKYLQGLATSLPIADNMKNAGEFSPHLFLEEIRPLAEDRPLVSYEIIDTTTQESIGWVPYETLESEPFYEDADRYQIEGMKIVDRGMGFDSQLSALYISSKTNKRHLRGKFGEGAKMSELHLLRHGAKMKMRSSYGVRGEDAAERHRTWQTRPKVKDRTLVSEGVEVERTGTFDTGSMVSVSLRTAKEDFQDEFRDNIDPRKGGLSRNVADYSSTKFVYPMPLTEEHISGVDISGDGEVQYVQGLRVGLAGEAFGYKKPWFSYDLLDSTVLAGRDRSELTSDIDSRIGTFWKHTDEPELLAQLVQTAVYGGRDKSSKCAELSALSSMLSSENGQLREYKDGKWNHVDVKRAQEILDLAMVSALHLEEGVPTLLISSADRHERNKEVIEYAQEKGYVIRETFADIGSHVFSAVASRLPDTYRMATLHSIRQQKKAEEDEASKMNIEVQTESALEKDIRAVFETAVASVNTLMQSAGREKKSFQLKFKQSRWPTRTRDIDHHSHHHYHSEKIPPPIVVSEEEGVILVTMEATDITNPRIDPRATQRQIEIYLLTAFGESELGMYGKRDKMEALKGAQRCLDELITDIIPDDSDLILSIPQSFEYASDPGFRSRFLETIFQDAGIKNEKKKKEYLAFREASKVSLTPDEAKSLQSNTKDTRAYNAQNILHSRVFLEDGVLTHWDSTSASWVGREITDKTPRISEWQGQPVYAIDDGRYFIPLLMGNGAVLAHGEGKKREYSFCDDDDFLYIGKDYVRFQKPYDVKVERDGLLIREIYDRERDSGMSEDAHIQSILSDYTYYPKGVSSREGRMVEGILTTAIPIEYGRNEWDNPVRVFQDIAQNHIDASGDTPVRLIYEVEREGVREWVQGDVFSADEYANAKITGLRVADTGSGYFPNEIATLGATSKKSPLFAGKYGEGQKMVAAASLRNGFELSYQSSAEKDGIIHGWNAQAVTQKRSVVLDGEPTEKHLVAFDISTLSNEGNHESITTIRLANEPTQEQKGLWLEWLSIIDPREKDRQGNGGLSRYVRQLRSPSSGRQYSMGSITVLLEEPGAVYENGLRINAEAESARLFSFGYDVPEIVTTRERNSFDPKRLVQYMQHILSNTDDPQVIHEVLTRLSEKKKVTPDTSISYLGGSDTSAPFWVEQAQSIWPEHLVYSMEALEESIHDITSLNDAYAKKALKIRANLKHLDRSKLLNVSKGAYRGFQNILPTAEDVLKKLETETIPISTTLRKTLSNVVAESAKVFLAMYSEASQTLTPDAMKRYAVPTYREEQFKERATSWSNREYVEDGNRVGVAPISSAFHGKAESTGVVFNEGLLLGNRRKALAEVALHEIAHTLSRQSDYTEEFVTLLYELTHYLASKAKRRV